MDVILTFFVSWDKARYYKYLFCVGENSTELENNGVLVSLIMLQSSSFISVLQYGMYSYFFYLSKELVTDQPR